MRIACVQDNGINESLALVELVGLLKWQGHTVDLFLVDEEADYLAAVRRFCPDVLLVPADVGGHHRFRIVTGDLKATFGLPIISGGIYPTLYEDDCLEEPHVDYHIVGEAEMPLPLVLQRLRAGESPAGIPGVQGHHHGNFFRTAPGRPVEDLDSLPMPDRGLYYKYPFIRNFRLKRFTTGRGCSYKCSYCWNPLLQDIYPKGTRLLRRKSVDRVIAEVQHVRSIARLGSIHFSDDLFVTRKDWLEEFADRFPREVGIGFTCNTTFEGMKDWAIDLLAEAGCRAVGMAVESGSDETRKEILNRTLTNERALDVAEKMHRRGLKLVTFNMLGIPGQDEGDAMAALEINSRLNAFHTRVTMTVTFPKADILRRGAERHALADGTGQQADTLADYRDGWQWSRRTLDFHNLMYVYPLAVRYKALRPLVPLLFRLPRLPILQFFQFFSFWREKVFFDLDLQSTVDYWWHTRKAMPRTKNYATLI